MLESEHHSDVMHLSSEHSSKTILSEDMHGETFYQATQLNTSQCRGMKTATKLHKQRHKYCSDKQHRQNKLDACRTLGIRMTSCFEITKSKYVVVSTRVI